MARLRNVVIPKLSKWKVNQLEEFESCFATMGEKVTVSFVLEPNFHVQINVQAAEDMNFVGHGGSLVEAYKAVLASIDNGFSD